MRHKINYAKVLPEGMRFVNALDMHSKDSRTGGEMEQWLYSLGLWRETPYYTDRERAGLAFTEAVTLLAQARVPDEVYERARGSSATKSWSS